MSTDYKLKFIAALRHFANEGGYWMPDGYGRIGYRESRGERALAGAIATYLEGPEVPGDEGGINWYVDLCDHLVEAFIEFRTLDKWAVLRAAYGVETEGRYEIPDLEHVHVGGLHRLLVVRGLARLCGLLSEQTWLQARLEAHFGAQQACIDQAWGRFVRTAYRQLMPRIKAESHRGNKGRFGTTTLMTYAMCGRVMFTFSRDLETVEETITYVADDSDMHGCRSGSNATGTPYADCVAMIDEVCDHWQLSEMVPDRDVKILGMP